MLFHDKCPLCGTPGKEWSRKDEIFQCPNCSSIFSKFGLLVESQREEDLHEFWS